MGTKRIREILSYYNTENVGTLTKLSNIFTHGKLGGTGKLLILAVDQGFEHGPIKSFADNSDAYDPNYHLQLAVDMGLSACAAPLGFFETSLGNYIGQIPTILKLNHSNTLNSNKAPDQAFTASVKDALRLGSSAVGLTIYPGSDNTIQMLEEAREVIREAKASGLAVVVWSYPRGFSDKLYENAIDICAYAAHIAALIGANIIKIKPPSDYITKDLSNIYKDNNINVLGLENRVKHIMQSCFNGKRIVIFSGGTMQNKEDLLEQIDLINKGGAYGSIIGRNIFKRKIYEAKDLIENIYNIYLNSKNFV